jgi:hypothetical protein
VMRMWNFSGGSTRRLLEYFPESTLQHRFSRTLALAYAPFASL